MFYKINLILNFLKLVSLGLIRSNLAKFWSRSTRSNFSIGLTQRNFGCGQFGRISVKGDLVKFGQILSKIDLAKFKWISVGLTQSNMSKCQLGSIRPNLVAYKRILDGDDVIEYDQIWVRADSTKFLLRLTWLVSAEFRQGRLSLIWARVDSTKFLLWPIETD